MRCWGGAGGAAVTQPLFGEVAPAPRWVDIDWGPLIHNRLVNERRIRYVDYGSGPALVLLHGMANSWQWWLENIPSLGQHHRVIAVDLPGCGNSEPLPPPAEMSTHAHTISDLLDQLGVRSATVAGHSMGGLVALEMATAHSELVRNLVLVDAGGVPMTERRLRIVLVMLRTFCVILRRNFVRRALATKPWVRRLLFRAAFRDPGVMSAQLAAQTMPLLNAPGFVDAVAASGRAVRSSVPEKIACPVLLVWGEHDRLAPVRCARDMHERLPDSELVILSGVGHAPAIECPERFNDAVLAFTATHPA
jgi:pimeloyl-ACP methyl ester carboxylesterase